MTLNKNHIRWIVIERDLPSLLKIEEENFEFPWSKKDFIKYLNFKSHYGMLSENKEKRVNGFVLYNANKTNFLLEDLAVGENYKRQGVGTQLIERLICRLSPYKKTKITLDLRETNLVAQLFFKKNGFKATNVLRDFYGFGDTIEDAFHMVYSIPKESYFVNT